MMRNSSQKLQIAKPIDRLTDPDDFLGTKLVELVTNKYRMKLDDLQTTVKYQMDDEEEFKKVKVSKIVK